MSKPKHNPHVNRVGIKIMPDNRPTIRIQAVKFAGLRDSVLRFVPAETIIRNSRD